MTDGTDAKVSGVSERRKVAVVAGHRGDYAVALAASLDPEPSVRVVGFGALSRSVGLSLADVLRGLADDDSVVVRRVIELVATFRSNSPNDSAAADQALLGLLAGEHHGVAEHAAWSLGERHQASDSELDSEPESGSLVVSELACACVAHPDALVREACAAALGAIGDIGGLLAILRATKDVATVRRRAVLALASFDGASVFEALTIARTDRDWQVRQAAEDLLQSFDSAADSTSLD